MTQNSPADNYGKVVSKAWTDHEFKARLKNDPKSALKELGIDVPAEYNINVVEDSPNNVTLVLPAAPKEGELSAEDLDSISGGTGTIVITTVVCVCA